MKNMANTGIIHVVKYDKFKEGDTVYVLKKEEEIIQLALNVYSLNHLGRQCSAMNKIERELRDNGWTRHNLHHYMPDTPGNTENCVFTKGEYKIAFNYYRNGIIVNDHVVRDFSHLDLSVYDSMPNKHKTEEWFETYKKDLE